MKKLLLYIIILLLTINNYYLSARSIAELIIRLKSGTLGLSIKKRFLFDSKDNMICLESSNESGFAAEFLAEDEQVMFEIEQDNENKVKGTFAYLQLHDDIHMVSEWQHSLGQVKTFICAKSRTVIELWLQGTKA